MKIHIGTDHRGFEFKEKVGLYLSQLGHEIIDHGDEAFKSDDDYPDYVHPLAHAVSEDPSAMGIIFGKSGQGEAMVANRYKGVRAIVCYALSDEIVRLGREHNNANVLSLGAGFLSEKEVIMAVEKFLNTPFSNEERHVRRIEKIDRGIF